MFKKNLGNVQEDSGKLQEVSGKCLKKFWGMFKKILGNVNLGLLYKI